MISRDVLSCSSEQLQAEVDALLKPRERKNDAQNSDMHSVQ